MPIEFRCSKCNKLLRVKDDTAGKQAKCPECGTVVQIPATSVSPGDDLLAGLAASDLGRPPAPPAENPYQSPIMSSPAFVGATGDIRPTQVALGDIYRRTWAIYKKEMGMCIGVVITANIISGVVRAIGQGVIALVAANAPSKGVVYSLGTVLTIAYILFTIWLTAGQSNFMLKTARGQDARFTDLFSGGPWVIPITVAGLIFTLISLVGYALLIVPGVIVALMMSQFMLLIIDRNMGIVDSLQQSREIMRGNKLTFFLMGLSWIGLTLLGCLACIVGLIIVGPFMTLMVSVFYLGVTGQPTAADRLPPGTAPVI